MWPTLLSVLAVAVLCYQGHFNVCALTGRNYAFMSQYFSVWPVNRGGFRSASRDWRNEMTEYGIRRASCDIEFKWSQSGTRFRDWAVTRVMYFVDDSWPGQQMIDSKTLRQIQDIGLEMQLRQIAIARAARGRWVDLPAGREGTGIAIVSLHSDKNVDDDSVTLSVKPLGVTRLMWAAIRRDVVDTSQLLKEGQDVNVASPQGATALIYAAGAGDPGILAMLIRAGADVNANPESRGTALMAAVGSDQRVMVEMLLAAGADPNIRNSGGETALALARSANNIELVRLLTKSGTSH
jgi:hypothetical protein